MSDHGELLMEAAEEVLENMFFSGVMGELDEEPPPVADGERICATVAFAGSSHGELRVTTPACTAAVLAAGFLGVEDEVVAGAQVRAVVGELANVLCGAILGRLSPDGQFVISPPEITDAGEAGTVCGMGVRRHFELMEGDLAVGLTVQ